MGVEGANSHHVGCEVVSTANLCDGSLPLQVEVLNKKTGAKVCFCKSAVCFNIHTQAGARGPGRLASVAAAGPGDKAGVWHHRTDESIMQS